MNSDGLETRMAELEHRLGVLEDVHAIRRLQHLYAYFIDKCMYDEAVDCFDEGCEIHLLGGIFRGSAGARRAYCDGFRSRFADGKNGPVFGLLLDHPQMQDVVDVAPDRQTARARFRLMMQAGSHHQRCADSTVATRQWWEGGLYENTYIKRDGVWRIHVLDYRSAWYGTFENGWAYAPADFGPRFETAFPDDPLGPDELEVRQPLRWPEHEVLPFHCVHPVTGRPISTPPPGRAADQGEMGGDMLPPRLLPRP
ncbi:MAG: nuclear transport factor 2 family protein [Thermoleophilia bacterium]|nr:nuclear transport factor 2 family protein [Thermoleophilia bacterium]